MRIKNVLFYDRRRPKLWTNIKVTIRKLFKSSLVHTLCTYILDLFIFRKIILYIVIAHLFIKHFQAWTSSVTFDPIKKIFTLGT